MSGFRIQQATTSWFGKLPVDHDQVHLALRAGLGALGAFTILRATWGLRYVEDAIVRTPLLFETYCLSMWLAWVLFIQAGLALGGMLWQRHRPGPPRHQVNQVKRNAPPTGHARAGMAGRGQAPATLASPRWLRARDG